MHHRLFIAALVVGHGVVHLVERLRHPGDIPVAENAEHAAEERTAFTVAFAMLDGQEPHQCLCHRHSS